MCVCASYQSIKEYSVDYSTEVPVATGYLSFLNALHPLGEFNVCFTISKKTLTLILLKIFLYNFSFNKNKASTAYLHVHKGSDNIIHIS